MLDSITSSAVRSAAPRTRSTQCGLMCDACDRCYHSTCVGLAVAPGAGEPWLCSPCRGRREAAAVGPTQRPARRRRRQVIEDAEWGCEMPDGAHERA